MHDATRADEELRQLLSRLEASGKVAAHPELQALLAASRHLLGEPPLPPRVARNAWQKLVHLGTLGLDAAAIGLALWGMGDALPSAAAAAWTLFRLRGHAAWLVEGALRLRGGLAWGWDWVAEAFSARAARRLAAREAARQVLRAWLRHAARLEAKPGLGEVEAMLRERYGPAAAEAFRQHAAGLPPFGTRWLKAMWRSALLQAFGAVAAQGAFWTPRPRPALPAMPRPAPTPEARPAVDEARRAALQDELRKRRQEVTTAHGWKMKTSAEIAERDRHLGELRGIIGALEAELKALS